MNHYYENNENLKSEIVKNINLVLKDYVEIEQELSKAVAYCKDLDNYSKFNTFICSWNRNKIKNKAL